MLPLTESRSAAASATALFRELDEAGIAWCHWKSNEHLDAALRGLTDLDVLVDRDAAASLAGILSRTGFKRFAASPLHSYPGIDDYLAFDGASGRLVHLHLHYQLTLGEPHLKGYRLPWERLVLDRRIRDPESGIAVGDPAVELLLLLVRAALKLRLRDLASLPWGRARLGGGSLVEYRWLLERVDMEDFLALARATVGEAASRRLRHLVQEPPSAGELLAFRRAVRPRLSEYRTYHPIGARWRRWRREARTLLQRVRRKLGGAPAAAARTIPQGGVIIALLGADGSGKSTVLRESTGWLARKLQVVPIYLGSGDGPVSPLRRPLWLLKAALRRRPRRSRAPAAVGAPPVRGGLRLALTPAVGLVRVLWALSLAHEKRGRLARARRTRNLGGIALCDRYPQCQIMGFTDGPLLDSWLNSPSRLKRALGRWERNAYLTAEACPPDLVIKLLVTPDVAQRRKPDTDSATLPARAEAIRALRFPAGTRVVEVSADQPLERVLREVKCAIWEAL